MKKRKNGKSPVLETFVASNGVKVEWAPDAKADKPLTDKEWAKTRRVNIDDVLSARQQKALSEFAVYKTRGRPLKPNKKQEVKLRIDPDIVAAYRAMGKGWQTRMNEALRNSLSE